MTVRPLLSPAARFRRTAPQYNRARAGDRVKAICGGARFRVHVGAGPATGCRAVHALGQGRAFANTKNCKATLPPGPAPAPMA